VSTRATAGEKYAPTAAATVRRLSVTHHCTVGSVVVCVTTGITDGPVHTTTAAATVTNLLLLLLQSNLNIQGSHSNDVSKFQDFFTTFQHQKIRPIVLPLMTFRSVLIRKHGSENVTGNIFADSL